MFLSIVLIFLVLYGRKLLVESCRYWCGVGDALSLLPGLRRGLHLSDGCDSLEKVQEF